MTSPKLLGRADGPSLCSLLHASVLTWAAIALPSRPLPAVAVLALVLAGLHVGAVLVSRGWPQRSREAWRTLFVASIGCGGVFLVAIGWTCVSVVQLFGKLGWGVVALLAPIALLVMLCTLPVGLWGLWATRPTRHAA